MENPTITRNPPLTASVLPTSDARSVLLQVRNNSEAGGELVFPNPYTGVELLTLQHKPIPHCSLFAWEHNDPRLRLGPGDHASAVLNLAPFWMDVSGEVLVRCKIAWKAPNREVQTWFAEGPIKLEFDSSADLARLVRSRQTTMPTSISSTPKLLNVSDYISIQKTAELPPPIRDEPTKLWE